MTVSAAWTVVRITAGDLGAPGVSTTLGIRKAIAEATVVLCEPRQEIGPQIILGIDLHHRLSVAEPASCCQKMASGPLDFPEKPIRHQQPAAYKRLRELTEISFAIGEECANKWDFLPYSEQGVANFAHIDVCNAGGISKAMMTSAMAESHYIHAKGPQSLIIGLPRLSSTDASLTLKHARTSGD